MRKESLKKDSTFTQCLSSRDRLQRLAGNSRDYHSASRWAIFVSFCIVATWSADPQKACLYPTGPLQCITQSRCSITCLTILVFKAWNNPELLRDTQRHFSHLELIAITISTRKGYDFIQNLLFFHSVLSQLFVSRA